MIANCLDPFVARLYSVEDRGKRNNGNEDACHKFSFIVRYLTIKKKGSAGTGLATSGRYGGNSVIHSFPIKPASGVKKYHGRCGPSLDTPASGPMW